MNECKCEAAFDSCLKFKVSPFSIFTLLLGFTVLSLSRPPMASSSAVKSCFQCEDSSPQIFKKGWRLRNGDFAQLCHRCAAVYEEGKFCECFHSSDDGWRDCESCGKLVHCGCIASFHAYLLLDFGGIICMECSKMNFLMARRRCLPLDGQIAYGDSRLNEARRIQIEPLYWPRATDSDLQQISKTPKCTVVPLFEKLLSATDADLALARLVIPTKCAETFFPDLSETRGVFLRIRDTKGKEWDFRYRSLSSRDGKVYVLEELRDFMISMKWQAGDVVTFYRLEPERKLVMGLRKSSEKPIIVHEVSP